MKATFHAKPAYAALALGAALALAGAPGAQAMQNQQSDNQTSGQNAGSQNQNGSFRLADAESLMGAKIESQDNKNIGTVKYLMIDPSDGSVVLALVQKPNMMDKFIAVPWRKLDIAHWQAAENGSNNKSIELMAPASVTKDAMTYSIKDVARLSTPIAQTKMYNVYGIPVPGKNGAENGNGTNNSQAMNEGSNNDEANESAQEEQNESSQNGNNQSNEQSNEQANAGQARPVLFVGHEFVGMVETPAVTLDNKLKGSEVVADNGNKIGTIKNIVIDLDHGRVAYALVDAQQNLGIGEKVPVPMSALHWSGKGTYTLAQGDKSDLQGAAQDLSDQSLPASVSASKLSQLYQRFDAQPYWRNGQNGQQGQ